MSIVQDCSTFCDGDKDCAIEYCVEPVDRAVEQCVMSPTTYESPAHRVTVTSVAPDRETAFRTCLSDADCRFVAVSYETPAPVYMTITDAAMTEDTDLPPCVDHHAEECRLTRRETRGLMFDKTC